MLLRVCVKMNCVDKLLPLMDSVCDENASAVIRSFLQPRASDRSLAEEVKLLIHFYLKFSIIENIIFIINKQTMCVHVCTFVFTYMQACSFV